jgi:hypothetical protein
VRRGLGRAERATSRGAKRKRLGTLPSGTEASYDGSGDHMLTRSRPTSPPAHVNSTQNRLCEHCSTALRGDSGVFAWATGQDALCELHARAKRADHMEVRRYGFASASTFICGRSAEGYSAISSEAVMTGLSRTKALRVGASSQIHRR